MYHCKYDILSLYTKMNNPEKNTNSYRNAPATRQMHIALCVSSKQDNADADTQQKVEH